MRIKCDCPEFGTQTLFINYSCIITENWGGFMVQLVYPKIADMRKTEARKI